MRRTKEEARMKVLVIGGAGFIGRRLIPLLLARGDEVACMDIAPAAMPACCSCACSACAIGRGGLELNQSEAAWRGGWLGVAP